MPNFNCGTVGRATALPSADNSLSCCTLFTGAGKSTSDDDNGDGDVGDGEGDGEGEPDATSSSKLLDESPRSRVYVRGVCSPSARGNATYLFL